MEHSHAILEDAGHAIDAAAASASAEKANNDTSADIHADEDERQNNYNRRKRKGDFPDSSMRHGSQRGGRGGGRNNNKRHKKGDLGRGEYFRDNPDKRQKTNASREKRLEGNGPQYGTHFSQEEIDAEERRPKRKVAVLIGYSGTGYKGMQISASEKTIEGDLFRAFVAAGAISKANADDPKKASLVRCARTDKGVHAAGNMISLKLIVEEDDIIEKINENLSSQIRVWGIERTIGSFSCYQACDSRWYEYLIPSYAFLPPHPSSWLAKKLEELADEAGDREGYEKRQEDVRGFWEKVEKEYIEPVLDTIDEDIRSDVIKALRGEDEAQAQTLKDDVDVEQTVKAGMSVSGTDSAPALSSEKTEEAAIIINEPALMKQDRVAEGAGSDDGVDSTDAEPTSAEDFDDPLESVAVAHSVPAQRLAAPLSSEELDRHSRLRTATKQLRQAYTTAKRRFRIHKKRIHHIQAALSKFVGTANYHNYTIQKTYRDASANRHIKSFIVNPTPILIGEGSNEEKSEWLSLKVHGQSFMMHQIRKMIGMVTLLVRCGSDLSALDDSLTEARYSIPKVPGLGLLLERPVFDSYNDIQAPKHGREKLDFGKYERAMAEFKEREIYQRIFREEEERNEFGKFFNHLDNFKDGHFLYVSSKGWEATTGAKSGRMVGASDFVGSDEVGVDVG